MNYDLSICIPARNEEFLKNTVEDLLKNNRGKTEIIVGLDGQWASPLLLQHPDVTVFYVPESIGQRSITKQCARLSSAKYIAKVDAHCSFEEGWDVKMLEMFEKEGDNIIAAPTMKNLHVFDWVCECGRRIYQDKPSLCTCGKQMTKEMVWIAKKRPNSTAYCFDSTPHFQYHNAYKAKQVGDYVESMSLQGSFFMLTREKYFDLDIDDESFGSWGSQGISAACRVWLSGGRVLINRKCWYAHAFRTKQENGFGFPYPLSGAQVERAKQRARELFFNNAWPKQTRPLHWLVERFQPPGWSPEDIEQLKKVPFPR